MFRFIRQIPNTKSELGEGIVYDSEKESLYWVDILGSKLYSYSVSQQKLTVLQTDLKYPSTIFPTEKDDNFLIASHRSIYLYDFNKNQVLKELVTITEPPSSRFNDGKIDKNGDLWIGTMDLYDRPNLGDFFKIVQRDQIDPIKSKFDYKFLQVKMLDFVGKEIKISISNGMAWSKNNKFFYYIDTPTREVKIFTEISPDRNTPTMQQISSINLTGFEGVPDGMTIDKETGYLYIAMWDGGMILVINPLKTINYIIDIIRLPVSRPTSCALGKNNKIYITSAYVKEEQKSGSVIICSMKENI